jgi:hypothetical protein
MIYPKENGIKIEEVPSVPPEILEAASSGRLVVFIGAGVSRIIGCPSWKEFAIKYLEYLLKKSIINFHEYENLKSLNARKLLSICRNVFIKSNTKPPSMESIFRGDKKSTIYNDLYSFNSIYVTTNYDTFLDELAKKTIRKKDLKIEAKYEPDLDIDKNEEKIPDKVFYKKEDIVIDKLKNGNVVHLHGSINDEDEVVMTIVDYLNHYIPEQKPAVFLQEIFEKYTVIFIGYGLEEYEIIEFIIRNASGAKDEIRHFMLYPMFTKNDNLLQFYDDYYRALGIRLIPYSIDERGYGQLAIVIKKWAKEISHISKPKGFYETIRLIDEVI